MRHPPIPVQVRRKPLAGEPAGPGFAVLKDAPSAPSLSLLDELVQALEGEIGSHGAPLSHYLKQPSAARIAPSDDPVRSDADAHALAAAGRQAILRGFDLAASAEELASGSGQVSQVMEDAGRKVRDALAGARGASGMILSLANAAEDMAGVVDVIASLARQANLLALHATIEAARAGDAGSDFASVAGDVKSFSEDTGQAARDLRARIVRLRETAASSMRAVDRIMAAVQEAQPALAAAAAAIEERNASLRDVAQHATDLTMAVGGMCTQADAVASLAQGTGRLAAAGRGTVSLDDPARPYAERFDTRHRY